MIWKRKLGRQKIRYNILLADILAIIIGPCTSIGLNATGHFVLFTLILTMISGGL